MSRLSPNQFSSELEPINPENSENPENLENLDNDLLESNKEKEVENKNSSSGLSLTDFDFEPSALLPDLPDNILDGIQTIILEKEVESSYLRYAMSVIVSRALPDVRDGMKPVHRRIVYVMNHMGLTPGAKYRKSAQVVGEVLGKYHPHGDGSVYGSMVRLAQDFSLRYPLIDGQGNFGSLDGDPAAAMRYTECKLTTIAMTMVADMEKDTVNFIANYDGSLQEPTVLPTRIPNLLINGQTGIAVGMATDIPPHNLAETMQALLFLLDNPEATIEELMQYIKGPDLPTGGILFGQEDMLQAYKTGRGKVVLRAKIRVFEGDTLIVDEIPYQINKADLVSQIADLVKDKKIEEIRDIRDESNKDGVRIVIELKKNVNPDLVLNKLYQSSNLQLNLHFNLLALIKRGKQPKLLNLKEILEEFLAHRKEVILRRSQFELKNTQAELHILNGLVIALDNIDETIIIIRKSQDKFEAIYQLTRKFSLSEIQATAILNTKLQALTRMDKNKLETKIAELQKYVLFLEEIIGKESRLFEVLKEEFQEIVQKFKSPRKTQIVSQKLGQELLEDFVEEEEVLVQMTKEQYLKVVKLSDFREQKRGGRGVSSFNAKDEDYVVSSQVCNSHDFLWAFTSLGRVFRTRVFQMPAGSRTGRGQNLINFFELKDGEKITNLLNTHKSVVMEDEKYSFVFGTQKGVVKKTSLAEFQSVNRSGKIALGLKENDQMIGVVLSQNPEKESVILSSDGGRTVIFSLSELRDLGRSAEGVRGIRLGLDDKVLSLQISEMEFEVGEE